MNEQIKAYIDNYPGEIIDLYRCLRQIVLSSAPCEPEETMWAKIPSFVLHFLSPSASLLPHSNTRTPPGLPEGVLLYFLASTSSPMLLLYGLFFALVVLANSCHSTARCSVVRPDMESMAA